MNINTYARLSIVLPTNESEIFAIYNTNFSVPSALQGSIFKDIREMDDELVRRWNSVVKKNDVVIHLGNFGNLSMKKKLNGVVFLVPNHQERVQSNNGDCYVANYSVTEETKDLNQLVFPINHDSDMGQGYQHLLYESFRIWAVTVSDQLMNTIKCEIIPSDNPDINYYNNYFLTNNVQWKSPSSMKCITGGFVVSMIRPDTVSLLNADAAINKYTPVRLKDAPGNIYDTIKDGIIINDKF